jgi:hypothetical protein
MVMPSVIPQIRMNPGSHSMTIPRLQLETPIADLPVVGMLVWERPHEKADGVIQRQYEIPEGNIILADWHGVLHEIIYQTPCEDSRSIAERNERLFAVHADGYTWNEILDNGFGKTYRRSDMMRFALWSYAMDFNTFGTMAFHDIKWG